MDDNSEYGSLGRHTWVLLFWLGVRGYVHRSPQEEQERQVGLTSSHY